MKPLAALAAVAALVGSLAASGCGDCSGLRQQASDLKAALGACGAGDTCVMVFPTGDACTGQLGCGFAVRAGTEAAALSEANRIGAASQGCTECAMVDCVDPHSLVATCDVASGRCETTIATRR
jgi:hypothetical protein